MTSEISVELVRRRLSDSSYGRYDEHTVLFVNISIYCATGFVEFVEVAPTLEAELVDAADVAIAECVDGIDDGIEIAR